MHGGPGCRLLSTTQRRLGYDGLIAELLVTMPWDSAMRFDERAWLDLKRGIDR